LPFRAQLLSLHWSEDCPLLAYCEELA
jgi:hypothetical protein